MGKDFAGINFTDDLNRVPDRLKAAGILLPPQLGAAMRFMNFRNHALYAQWDKTELAPVESALALVQESIITYFSS
jgi:hypothetical protein